MDDNRSELRTTFRAQIKLTHPSLGIYNVVTRDLSNSGLFLVWDTPFEVNVGDEITVQSLDIDDAPVLQCRVVRIESSGIAVTYLLDE